MKHHIFLLNSFMAVILIVLIFSCGGPSPDREPSDNAISDEIFLPESNGYRLVWEDDFDGTGLDTTKWRSRGEGPRRLGYNDCSMIEVKDGLLLLKYDIVGDSVLGCAVGTQYTFQTRYGYFEARARLQHSIGPWAAFWLQSPKISEGADPAEYGTEIDIFEYFKELGDDVVTSCLHWAYGPDMQSSDQMVSRLEGLGRGFHTFGLEWTPESYSFFIDGLKFHEQRQGVSHIDEYMILSMELPERLQNIKMACAPDTFAVDYVRVYSLRDSVVRR